MIIEKIGTGKTLEEAVSSAKKMLNAPAEATVETKVLETGKKGFLGIGAKDYKVSVSYDDGKKPEAPKREQKKPAAKPAQKKKTAPKKTAEPKKEAPVKKEAPAKKEAAPKSEQVKREYPKSVDLEGAKAYLASILKGLQVNEPKIDASYDEGVVTMNLECEDYGIIIGHRGETLDSIQYLLSLVVKKSTMEYVRVVINVGNYREKRQETLKNLARKNAQYVLRTGRRHTFEPMNPYERRIIHTAVQEMEGVRSLSIGYNQDRRVVIEPVDGVKKSSNGNYRRGSKPQSVTKAPANHTPKADRADLPKFGKIEVNK